VLGSHTGCVTIFLDGQRYKIEDRTKSNCGGIDLVGEVVAGNPR